MNKLLKILIFCVITLVSVLLPILLLVNDDNNTRKKIINLRSNYKSLQNNLKEYLNGEEFKNKVLLKEDKLEKKK